MMMKMERGGFVFGEHVDSESVFQSRAGSGGLYVHPGA
jgi:hypothetical protein